MRLIADVISLRHLIARDTQRKLPKAYAGKRKVDMKEKVE